MSFIAAARLFTGWGANDQGKTGGFPLGPKRKINNTHSYRQRSLFYWVMTWDKQLLHLLRHSLATWSECQHSEGRAWSGFRYKPAGNNINQACMLHQKIFSVPWGEKEEQVQQIRCKLHGRQTSCNGKECAVPKLAMLPLSTNRSHMVICQALHQVWSPLDFVSSLNYSASTVSVSLRSPGPFLLKYSISTAVLATAAWMVFVNSQLKVLKHQFLIEYANPQESLAKRFYRRKWTWLFHQGIKGMKVFGMSKTLEITITFEGLRSSSNSS